MTRTPLTDLAFSALVIAICSAVLWESRRLPPGSFEPLGSAPVPQVAAALIIFLSLIVLIKTWWELHRPADDVETIALRWGDACFISTLTVLYILVLDYRAIRFDILTAIYLFLAIGLLARFHLRSLPAIAVVAGITGFATQFLFTKVFVVDLPGAL